MAYDASRNVILYYALKECLERMYQEKKFDHYQYKFNPLIFRGSDVALEDRFADSGGHFEKMKWKKMAIFMICTNIL